MEQSDLSFAVIKKLPQKKPNHSETVNVSGRVNLRNLPQPEQIYSKLTIKSPERR